MRLEAKGRKSNASCAMSGRYLLDFNILIDLLEGNEAISKLSHIADSELFVRIIAASAIITESVLVTRDSRLTSVKWPGLQIHTLTL